MEGQPCPLCPCCGYPILLFVVIGNAARASLTLSLQRFTVVCWSWGHRGYRTSIYGASAPGGFEISFMACFDAFSVQFVIYI
jgi:hypothetical protein